MVGQCFGCAVQKQLLCRFELIGITETHLDKTVRDEALQIEGMKLLRLDRKGRKGGRCM